MLKTIQEWLADPKRKYADGLAIFKTASSPDIKKKYGEYFSSVVGEPDQFDMHYGMLVNKVSDIENKMRVNPDAFKNLKLVVAAVSVDNSKEIADKEAEIAQLKATIDSFNLKKVETPLENEVLTEKTNSTETELTETTDALTQAEEKLLALETELTVLKEQRGISIVQYDNLPAEIKKLYDRVKVITPFMASLHADISVENLNVNTRKSLVKKLCDLDDERRNAWDAIDAWSEGKTVEPVLEKSLYSDDKIVKGMQMARRIIQLKENIRCSQETADKADRETIKLNAIERISAYEKELAQLQVLLIPTDGQETI